MIFNQIFNGNAQQLADLTRPFESADWFPFNMLNNGNRPISTEAAAAIIFAAAWSHLIPDRNSSATIEHGACGEFGVIHNGQFVKWCLSPLHAVLAAVSRMGVSNPTR